MLQCASLHNYLYVLYKQVYLNHFLQILTESVVSLLVMITSEMGTVS